ncbi:MAG TPA: putative baseplate assembly protein, partial [Verrucomicrobiae bacterium]|nr:putative baseplate assembly protein [Verrucomicrobiae bacterium]
KRVEPEINYLAKDYASFRQVILDRLALLMPGWQEQHVPDIGIALVELLAYAGDYLSYYQDAIATEAYLDTARQRISVRRHARLIDYQMHEGCNARAWITITAGRDDASLTLRNVYFTTGDDSGNAEVFEPLAENLDTPLKLIAEHNTMYFYTWGNQQCCLPRGATRATLRDGWVAAPQAGPATPTAAPEIPPTAAPAATAPPRLLSLNAGDVLIFEEVKGPKTGNPDDADPSRRWAVRLISVVSTMIDPLNKQPVVEIEWAPEDALPFPFCLSARRPAPDCDLVCDVSVAHGNVILVDHGQTIDSPESLGQVEEIDEVGTCACEGSVVEMTSVAGVFGPCFKQSPVTFGAPLNASLPASQMLQQDPRKALPQISDLTGLPGVCPRPGSTGVPQPVDGSNPADAQWRWRPRSDLLESGSQDQDFVVEVDNDGTAHLRFGDGALGRMPDACTIFSAIYRIGNGAAGNVGADTITTIKFRDVSVNGATLQPRNPLPARGGTEPEPMAEVKLFAPGAFRKALERAVTAADYATIAERNQQIQQANAVLRWTGSWYETEVAVDPIGTETADAKLLKDIKDYLFRYRRLGHDLSVIQAQYVPLDIEMTICVLPQYQRGHVEVALLDVFSDHVLPDGQLGFFHPDNLTFGEGIYLSQIIAAAQAVPGVQSVTVTAFQRLFEGDNGELKAGILKLGPMEIAQLDNDPNFPEHGVLKLTLRGGR